MMAYYSTTFSNTLTDGCVNTCYATDAIASNNAHEKPQATVIKGQEGEIVC
jgi:hypothetical protein